MKKAGMMLVLICLAICFLLNSKASAAGNQTYTCTGTNDQTGVATALGNTSDGGTLTISGSCTFSAPVTATNRNVEIRGDGNCTLDANGRPSSCPTTITVVGQAACGGGVGGGTSAFCFSTTSAIDGTSSTGWAVKKVSWRLHDLAITGTPPTGSFDIIQIITMYYNYPVMGWRIDHIKMDFPYVSGGMRFIFTGGVTWGLIDHVSLNSAGNILLYQDELLDSEYYAAWNAGARPGQSWEGNFAWSLPLHLGSDEALYVEDSLLNITTTSPVCANDMAAGASIVMRHNLIQGATAVLSHTGEDGTLGRGGARKYEI